MMDHLYREFSVAFPGHIISDVDVCQESETYRVVQIEFGGTRPQSLFRSFLHERSQVAALVESCLHDAQDLGLMFPYDQLNEVLLAACEDIEVTSTDSVLVLKGAGVGAKSAWMRPVRPCIEGCILRGDKTFARMIAKPKEDSLLDAFNEPMTTIEQKKILYLAVIALHAIVSGHQHAASHTNDMLARQRLMLALTRLSK